MKHQLNKVLQELNAIKQERQEKEIRKQAHANRKRLPKRDPMTGDIYKKLLKASEGPTYIHVQLRITLCLFTITRV